MENLRRDEGGGEVEAWPGHRRRQLAGADRGAGARCAGDDEEHSGFYGWLQLQHEQPGNVKFKTFFLRHPV